MDDENRESITNSEIEAFENDFYTACSIVDNILEQHTGHLVTSDNNEPLNVVSNLNGSVNNSNVSDNSSIKLPPLKLPTFDGDYGNWLFFKDSFNSIIHQNSGIDNIQKFHYLRLSLVGEAAKVVQSLGVSAANYSTAWELLNERYENKVLLVNNHVRAIFNLPTLSMESHTVIRQLLDGITQNTRALEALGQPVSQWDTLLIHILSNKLDGASRREWESLNHNDKLPTFKEFLEFLQERCRLLEVLNINPKSTKMEFKGNRRNSFQSSVSGSSKCSFCGNGYLIYNCKDFLKLNGDQRLDEAMRLKLCLNCLRKGHQAKDCRCQVCNKCQRKHNSLLHLSSFQFGKSSNPPAEESETVSSSSNSLHTRKNDKHGNVLLSTAIVQVRGNDGNMHECRALLDCGSESNFITEELCDILKLPKSGIDLTINGIGHSSSKIVHKVSLEVQSRLSGFKFNLPCLVIKNITRSIPQFSFSVSSLNIPANCILADPTFNQTDKIHLLMGAGIFWDLLCSGQIKLGRELPILQKTKLGWLVSGPLPLQETNVRLCNLSTEGMESLNRFWEIEDYPKVKPWTEEETLCENHFITTTKRNEDGRFIVSLPFKDSLSSLGDTRNNAIKRFYSIERKFTKDVGFQNGYQEFINEYKELNHMTRVGNDVECDEYFFPHHAVIKISSTTTRLRVVFDASAKSSSGVSLNDIMMVGPTIQDDLFSILLRFRQHDIVVTADIAKMYRQVLVEESQRNLQKIIWRSNPSNPMEIYQLNTVTYGTAAAAFLTTRCLNQLAYDFKEKLPQASETILNSFYVDDLLFGGQSVHDLVVLKNDITKILLTGGFQLRKWVSNSSEVLEVSEDVNESTYLKIGAHEPSRTLGLKWIPGKDVLNYEIEQCLVERPITKRSILSSTSQLFDPLGLLSPVIIVPKILIQELWKIGSHWDESIPLDLHTKWRTFRKDLELLRDLEIPRQVLCRSAFSVQLHGFSDASEKAHGTCLYMKSFKDNGLVESRLLCAKRRVAPIKGSNHTKTGVVCSGSVG